MNSKAPRVVLEHYDQLMKGFQRERNGIVIREGGRESFSDEDMQAMDQLLKQEMTTAWRDLEANVGCDWLPRVFDALWMSKLNWNAVRNYCGDSRRVVTERKVAQITSAASKLENLLNELRGIAAEAGGGPSRYPDRWPDSPSLRLELEALKYRCSMLDVKQMSPDHWVNAASSARESVRAYLHALVAKLDEIGFPFGEKRVPTPGLCELADAVDGATGAIDYDAFYKVLRLVKKNISE